MTCNALLSACGAANAWPKALALLEALPAMALQADVVSYSAVCGACGKATEWRKALEASKES